MNASDIVLDGNIVKFYEKDGQVTVYPLSRINYAHSHGTTLNIGTNGNVHSFFFSSGKESVAAAEKIGVMLNGQVGPI